MAAIASPCVGRFFGDGADGITFGGAFGVVTWETDGLIGRQTAQVVEGGFSGGEVDCVHGIVWFEFL